MSDQLRRVLAATLAGFARGLTTSARLVEQVSWILRPREPAAADRERAAETAGGPGTGGGTVAPAGATGPADGMEPGATDVMEPGGAGLDAMDAAPAGPAEPADGGAAAAPAPAGPPDAAEDVAPAEGIAPAEPPPTTPAEPPPTTPAPEGPDRAPVAESHIAALGDRPVSQVVSEIPNLSTDELEDLYAYEVTHKNRKTVLRAIERAVAPDSS